MERRETRLKSDASVTVSTVGSGGVIGTDSDAKSCARVIQKLQNRDGAGCVVEICDKDYRSFGLPCDVLEDTGDSESED